MEITQESNPTLWNSLYALWLEDKRPGWVVNSKQTYRVIQKPDQSIAFLPMIAEGMYESTSIVR